MEEAGANKEVSPKEARVRILAHEFSREEKEALEAAALSFAPSLSGHAIMVRSDEWAGGTGIWKSGHASALIGDEKTYVQRVLEAAKNVLASGFSEAAARFRERNGINEGTGIMLMPIYGENFETEGEKCIAPPIMASLMSKNGNPVLARFGTGIDGVNGALYDGLMGGYYYGLQGLGGVSDIGRGLVGRYERFLEVLKIGKSSVETSRDNCNEDSWRAEGRIASIVNVFGGIAEERGARYYEVCLDSWHQPNWVVVQAAEPKINDAPNIGLEGFFAKADDAVGVGKAECNGIVHIEIEMHGKAGEIKKKMWGCLEQDAIKKGYMLVVEAEGSVLGAIKFEEVLEQLENVAAIVFSTDEMRNQLVSHLNGRLRDLDVPIIAIEKKQKELADLEKDGQYVIYANEWAAEGEIRGFLARKQ